MVSHFVGHIEPAIILAFMSLWWLVNIAHRYYSAPYNQKAFFTSSSFGIGFVGKRCKDWPVESYARVVLFVFSAAYDTTDAFTINRGIHHFMQNPHTLIMALFGLSGLLEILLYHRVPLPPNIEYFAFGAFFTVEALILKVHLVGRPHIDVLVHTLLAYVVIATSLTVYSEIKYRHSYLVAFLRCFLVLFQATWLAHVGMISDDENENSYKWNVHHEYTKAMSYFVWHGIIDLLISLLIAGLVKLFVWRQHKHGSRDDMDEYSGAEKDLDFKTCLLPG